MTILSNTLPSPGIWPVARHKPQAHPGAGVGWVVGWPRLVGEYLFRRSAVYAANVGRSINMARWPRLVGMG